MWRTFAVVLTVLGLTGGVGAKVRATEAICQPSETLPAPPPLETPGALAAIDQLKAIVAARDAQALLGLLHDQVQIDLGGTRGLQAFAERWLLPGTAKPVGEGDVWAELSAVLTWPAGRVAANGSRVVVPYFAGKSFQSGPGAGPFPAAVVRGGAKLNAFPKDDTKTLAILPPSVLNHFTGDPTLPGWLPLSVSAQCTGYVREENARLLSDYRLGLAPVGADSGASWGADWRIVFFVRGP